MGKIKSNIIEWLSMVEVTGPFLAIPVLKKVFNTSFSQTALKKDLARAYEEWRDDIDQNNPQSSSSHQDWILFILQNLLKYDSSSLLSSHNFSYQSSTQDYLFSPDYVLINQDHAPLLFISTLSDSSHFQKSPDKSPDSILDRMILLCRAHKVRIALITNGEQWTLVNAPLNSSSSYISWFARIWVQEPSTLYAFENLLSIDRFYSKNPLSDMLEDSLEYQEEITNTLGEQVKHAVEVLIQSLDKANQDRNNELLRNIPSQTLYESALTVMMRLVFILCAEERGLLFLGNPIYDQFYAISSLRSQLSEEADKYGDEVLENQYDAWIRLLAVFRSIYAGIHHDALRLPALGGSLFDPDRFPFLEGRAPKKPSTEDPSPSTASWRYAFSNPLPVNNRTVLLLLEALQILKQHDSALSISYKTLAVEQIGHVYEGLLEHTVSKIKDNTLGLVSSKKAKNPDITLGELESARMDGIDGLIELLQERSERNIISLQNALNKKIDDSLLNKMMKASAGNMELLNRLKPFAHLIRKNAWGDLVFYPKDSYIMTLGTDRRESGTHYTPRSLAEEIVHKTLEPIAYIGPSDGTESSQWQLKAPEDLLALKVCDPAMGSGAFLVETCRWLANRLIESWEIKEKQGYSIRIDGIPFKDADYPSPSHKTSDPLPNDQKQNISKNPHLNNESADQPSEQKIAGTANLSLESPLSGADDSAIERMPKKLSERKIIARRLVAEKCLYGVDFNPLAVELAKLSIWLITLSKGRPFDFLDHNFRSGNSLLGLTDFDQLTQFSMNPDKEKQMPLFNGEIKKALEIAIQKRKELRKIVIHSIKDVQKMQLLNDEAVETLKKVEEIVDAMIAEFFADCSSTNQSFVDKEDDQDQKSENTDASDASKDQSSQAKGSLESNLLILAENAHNYLKGERDRGKDIINRSQRLLKKPKGWTFHPFKPFHWGLEFPEVFQSGGFNAMLGNPPFMSGKRISGAYETNYREYLFKYIANNQRGSADLCAYFFLRAANLIKIGGTIGFLATNTIAQGDTRQVGLEQLVQNKISIYSAFPNLKWPGKAVVVVSYLHLFKGQWKGEFTLKNKKVPYISPFLTPEDDFSPHKLRANKNKSFIGAITQGMGFTMPEEQAMEFIKKEPKNKEVLYPFLNGKDLNSSPSQSASRWVVNFWDWPLKKAMEYKEPFAHIDENVKHEREKAFLERLNVRTKKLFKYWWLYERLNPTLYYKIGRGGLFIKHPKGAFPKKPLKKVLVTARTSKYFSVSWVPNDMIFSDATVILATENNAEAGLLASGFYNEWVWKNASTMGAATLRYTPSDCFESFPYPDDIFENLKLAELADAFFSLRKDFMLQNQLGLTSFYNQFHNPEFDHVQDFIKMKELIARIDHLVACAYGWQDIPLDHDIHQMHYLPDDDNKRFGISNNARYQILKRLFQLNQTRYMQELKKGLHGKNKNKLAASKKKIAFSNQANQSFDFNSGLFILTYGRKLYA